MGGTRVLKFIADKDFKLPETIEVTGATSVWDKKAGTLTLSNPTDNVIISIKGV